MRLLQRQVVTRDRQERGLLGQENTSVLACLVGSQLPDNKAGVSLRSREDYLANWPSIGGEEADDVIFRTQRLRLPLRNRFTNSNGIGYESPGQHRIQNRGESLLEVMEAVTASQASGQVESVIVPRPGPPSGLADQELRGPGVKCAGAGAGQKILNNSTAFSEHGGSRQLIRAQRGRDADGHQHALGVPQTSPGVIANGPRP